MKIVGIIAEYNPFHNGHEWHIRKAKEITGADYAVVVMSGDFVQRGEPAIVNKHLRTEMALHGGADLVIELPVRYACGSAESFSCGAVSLLEALGGIDTLCFGCEMPATRTAASSCSGNFTDSAADVFIKESTLLAGILTDEPPAYRSALKSALASGLSFPAAREQALISAGFVSEACCRHFLRSPNALLGVEYCRAIRILKAKIRPVAVPRIGSGYRDETLSGKMSSATAIRAAIRATDSAAPDHALSISSQMPPAAWSLLRKEMEQGETVEWNDYTLLLIYKLLSETAKSLTVYQDVTPDLARRILAHKNELTDIDSFISLLKTRNFTYTRISRALLHILLNIRSFTPGNVPVQMNRAAEFRTVPDTNNFASGTASEQIIPYAHILGFRKAATPLLHKLKGTSRIPLITKTADRRNILSGPALDLLEEDMRCTALYESVSAWKAGRTAVPEESVPVCMV